MSSAKVCPSRTLDFASFNQTLVLARKYPPYVLSLALGDSICSSSSRDPSTQRRPDERSMRSYRLGQVEGTICGRETSSYREPSVSSVIVTTSDRFQEYDVIIQSQRNMLFRAFGIWQSKTKVNLLRARSCIST
jgi:hypothetical protein